MGDLGIDHVFDGTVVDSNFTANPCGLIAKSVFNDTYSMQNAAGDQVSIDDQNIAWDSDKENKFVNAENWESVQWLNVTDRK